jgi:hypothetical protein
MYFITLAQNGLIWQVSPPRAARRSRGAGGSVWQTFNTDTLGGRFSASRLLVYILEFLPWLSDALKQGCADAR